MNGNTADGKHLPRIQSQRKVSTPFERTSTRQALNSRPLSNNMKRTHSSANVSKNVKYESAGVVYKKKIEELEKKNELIENEMKNVQMEIDFFRKETHNKKKGLQSDSKTESRLFKKTLNPSDSNAIRKEIKLYENKITTMRKKIDEQNERNVIIKTQIDSTRKQIQTLKGINKKTSQSLAKTKEEYCYFLELSSNLDVQISEKNSAMHKAKVQSIHKKAEVIKQYDNILKEIQKELDEIKQKDTDSEIDNEAFYMTEVGVENHMKGFSPSKRKTRYDPTLLKEKIESYEKQFEMVKETMGTNSTEEIIQKFQEGYEKNFDYYKFINEQFEVLKEVQEEYEELQKKKEELIKDLQNHTSDIKYDEIVELDTEIEKVQAQKNKTITESQEYDNIYKELKEIVKDYYEHIGLGERLTGQITQKNIIEYLHQIKDRVLELNAYEVQQIPQEQVVNYNLDELLEQAKREEGKNDKLLTQEELVESHQQFLRKKQQRQIKRKKK